jgi:hypothetical protein
MMQHGFLPSGRGEAQFKDDAKSRAAASDGGAIKIAGGVANQPSE